MPRPANHRAPVNLSNRLLNTSEAPAPSSHARSILGRLGITTEREFFAALAPLTLKLTLTDPSSNIRMLRS